MELGGWLIVALGVLVVLCLVPLAARQRMFAALDEADERFSLTSRTVKPSGRPVVTGGGGAKLRLHPYSRAPKLAPVLLRTAQGQISAATRPGLGEGTKKMLADRQELARALRQRSAVRGQAALSAQRRRVALFVTVGAAAFLLLLVAFSVLPAWILILPVVAVVLTLAHGLRSARRFEAELAQAQIRVQQVKESGHVGLARQTRAQPDESDAGIMGANQGGDSLASPAEKAEQDLSQRRPQIAENLSVADEESVALSPAETEPHVSVSPQKWEPQELPRPLYQMRALAPRRRIDVPAELAGNIAAPVRPRPVQVRPTDAPTLSSEQVAAGATFDFDVDSVIERRRAAS